MTILRRLFLYLSRFVSRPALDGLFVIGSGDDYEALRDDLQSKGDELRNPLIGDFIFGINVNALQTRLSSVKGLYLFVDYASISSTVSPADVKTDVFRVSITVAFPLPENSDQATELLRQDAALEALSGIRRHMRDDYTADGVSWIRFPSTIQPFSAPDLARSIGWTMEIDVTGVDMV